MKKILIAFAALATIAACNKAEVLETPEGDAIQFGNAFVDNVTKAAADPSYGASAVALDHFNVYGTVGGVNIFNGNAVTKGGADYGAAWTCAGQDQYWVAGASYIFDAVVDATAVTTDANTGLPTSLNYLASTQKDMLYKRVTTTGKPASGLVQFTFTHLLSKVKFTVENETPSTATNYQYTITDIKITNTITEGNYAVSLSEWTTESTGDHTIADMTVASAATEECATEVLLVPGASVGVSFNVNVQVKNGVSSQWETLSTIPVAKTAVATLDANTAYNFLVTVGLGDNIKFTAMQMTNWDNAADTPVSIQ